MSSIIMGLNMIKTLPRPTQARELDALIAREGTAALPPLAGIPIAIKV